MGLLSIEGHLISKKQAIPVQFTENIDGELMLGKKGKQLKRIFPFLQTKSLNDWLRKLGEEKDTERLHKVLQSMDEYTVLHFNKKKEIYFPDDIVALFQELDFPQKLRGIGEVLTQHITSKPSHFSNADLVELKINNDGFYYISLNDQENKTFYMTSQFVKQDPALSALKGSVQTKQGERLTVKRLNVSAILPAMDRDPLEVSVSPVTVFTYSAEDEFQTFKGMAKKPWQKAMMKRLSSIKRTLNQERLLQLNGLLGSIFKGENLEVHVQQVMDDFLEASSQIVKVGVISPFTYGKSTFINSMIQQPLLAEDILVKTASITKIHYGKNYYIKKSDPASPVFEQFKEFAKFRYQLHRLTTELTPGADYPTSVEVPFQTKKKNIVYIDTPGLFGPHPEHDQMTERYLVNLDFIIYLIDATKAGYEPYTKKIREFQQKYKKKCLFVINKIDLIPKKTDQDLVKNEIIKNLAEEGIEAPVFMMSSYFASKVRFYKQGLIELDELKKSPYIFAKEQDEIISGRALKEKHLPSIEKLSGIREIEDYLHLTL
ncbi:dynamin family protein [Jeotgalibacillus proteolyticus]|uniref:dynamin family protein n=1 Tax=Jeotgalibacillus proteolyticus TaxID=2082395 RepID=UPI003CFA9F64